MFNQIKETNKPFPYQTFGIVLSAAAVTLGTLIFPNFINVFGSNKTDINFIQHLSLIFQHGYFTGSLTGFVNVGGVDITLPILIFAIAFGLSMDYASFLYARMREEYDNGASNDEAVLLGLQKTGPIITAAALVLFVVVVAFAMSKLVILQQVGVGLASAVLIDAFIVRLFLVPATMKLIGRANWYAPKWMNRFAIRHD